MINLPVILPKIIVANDYHEFIAIQQMFAKFGAHVNYREFDHAAYAAIFYIGEFDDICEQLIDQFNGPPA